jgi:hypothetical protein
VATEAENRLASGHQRRRNDVGVAEAGTACGLAVPRFATLALGRETGVAWLRFAAAPCFATTARLPRGYLRVIDDEHADIFARQRAPLFVGAVDEELPLSYRQARARRRDLDRLPNHAPASRDRSDRRRFYARL